MRLFAAGFLLLLSIAGCTGKKPVYIHSQFPRSLQLGQLELTTDQAAGWMVLRDLRLNRNLIRFPLDDAFVTVAAAEDRVGYRMASFRMGEKIRMSCDRLEWLAAAKTADGIALSGRLHCERQVANLEMKISPGEGGTVKLSVETRDSWITRLRLKFLAEENEHVFGGGEQFTYFDLRGRRVPIISEEQGIGRGAEPITTGANLTHGAGGDDMTTYAPIPFFVTTAFRSFDSAQTVYQVWDFSRQKFSVEVWDKRLEVSLAVAQGYGKLIELYTARTGRMQPLPDWAAGTILGVQGGKEKAEQVLNAALAAGNPVTAIWIQDWVGRRQTSFGSQLWWRWLPDESSYPNFRTWVQSLEARGIKVLGYINPFLADEGPIFEEARKQKYLVRNTLYEPYRIQTAGFPAYLIDLSNPKAREFLKDIIKKNLLANSLSGYMADFGEWLPWDARLASEESPAAWHNRYPVEWAKLNREAIREAGLEGRVLFFTRAGYTGSAGFSTLFWVGDQMVTFDEYDGLASAVTGILSGGISGISLNHSDVGGYTTITHFLKNYHRNRELLLRWAEFAVFTPVFRNHEGNRPDKNYQVYSDDRITAEYAALAKVHMKLKPYFRELMEEAAKTGMPVLRPMVIHYPTDRNTWELRHQAMLGRDLVVAPVLQKGAETGRVYLPAGEWLDPATGNQVRGGHWHIFSAPLGRASAFIRLGSPHESLLREALSGQK